jgi:hypothetical protein
MKTFKSSCKPNRELYASCVIIAQLIFLCTGAFAQQQAYVTPAGTKFLLYTPPGYTTTTTTYPLLLSLHSKGEVGDDLNELTINNPEQMPCRLIYLNKWPLDLPFIVLTPQLKPTVEEPDPQWPADYIDEVVRYVVSKYRVDLSRIYLTGISRGGTGVWTYASSYPQKIAAMVPLSGRSDLTQACPVKDIPIWAFHGDGDPTAPTIFSVDMVNAIRGCSPAGKYKPQLYLLNAKGHLGWNEVYNGTNGYKIFNWLLQFKKNDFTNRPPYVNAGPDYKIHLRGQPFYLVGDYFDSEGSITNVEWTQTAGAALTLGDTNSRYLKLTGLKTGVFEFELSVTDNNGLTKKDRVSLEVVNTDITPKINSLILVNGKTNLDIAALTEDFHFEKLQSGVSEINIRATISANTLSVRFSINTDQNTRTINSSSPLFIKPQSINPEWNIAPGDYLICATPYSGSNATGTKGVTQCYKIHVTDGEGCAGTGTITREVWNGIPGNTVSAIPTNLPPDATGVLSTFEAPLNAGNDYGARISGFICPPASGNYIFWIASDDQSELWLSTDGNAANKRKIASVTGNTSARQWTKYPSQQSVVIHLEAGQKYFIEALHKEASAGDHVEVGWQLPNGALERPIPGHRLLPLISSTNNPPVVNITSPLNNQNFTAGASIAITANASDSDGSVNKVTFFRGSTKLADDILAPYSYTWTNAIEGTYSLTAVATDNSGSVTISGAVNITVSDNIGCTAEGKIVREYWGGITGLDVAAIPVTTTPTSTSELTIFEGPINAGTYYGARIRGYICAPFTGSYTFFIASDDKSELWLSTDESAAHKIKIAFVSGATLSRQWNKYTGQQSAPVNLVQGQRYYIEALHKENSGSDNIAVGWQLPGGVLERPIPGTRLSRYSPLSPLLTSASLVNAGTTTIEMEQDTQRIDLFSNPTHTGDIQINVTQEDDSPGNQAAVTVTSLTGKIVFKGTFNCDGGCNLKLVLDKSLEPGVYFAHVTLGGKYFNKRFIVAQ